MEPIDEHCAFMEKFTLQPSTSTQHLPLHGLTFAVKDIFDVEGYVTGFGNPDWGKTHSPASSTAPAIMRLLEAGATCVGKTVMDEMAYSINGENVHFGTPRNPVALDRVPGGSSSGSAVAVGANIVDFSLGTDTGGSVRVPASFCGILGFRPSHGVVSVDGVVPMAQSFDTVGLFARDPTILNRVGHVLLALPDASHPSNPSRILIPDDCFELLTIPIERVKQVFTSTVEKLFGGDIIKHVALGDYVKDSVPNLMHFMDLEGQNKDYNIPSLVALSISMRSLQRFEFKSNHSDWVTAVQPNLGPGIAERVWDAIRTTDESVEICKSVRTELRAALTSLLGEYDILAIPTVPGTPPKLKLDPSLLEGFRSRAFSLLSIAGVSGFCQVSIPLGMHDDLPVSISLLARHGSDKFLLSLVETMNETLKEQSRVAQQKS